LSAIGGTVDMSTLTPDDGGALAEEILLTTAVVGLGTSAFAAPGALVPQLAVKAKAAKVSIFALNFIDLPVFPSMLPPSTPKKAFEIFDKPAVAAALSYSLPVQDNRACLRDYSRPSADPSRS
jgi:hypothetical protein